MNNNMGKMNPREIKIQGLLDVYMRQNSSNNTLERTNHLDEDNLTAFVEGTLNEREAKPITNHLVNCSFCRHITAELIKLDMVFAEHVEPLMVSTSPTKVSEVLNGVLSRIFGTSDGAVFAHQESEENDIKEKANDKSEEE